MSEMRDRMLAGELYIADTEIAADHHRCVRLTTAYNATGPDDEGARRALLEQLLGGIGEGTVLRPPIHFDYGSQTTIGRSTFVNFGAVFLDVGEVRIGDHVQVGPNVQFLTATHPIDPDRRRAGWEAQEPVTVDDNVWLGGGAILCPGVTVGADSVVGAGSVVTRDVPPGVVAAGNPCRVLREISPADPTGTRDTTP